MRGVIAAVLIACCIPMMGCKQKEPAPGTPSSGASGAPAGGAPAATSNTKLFVKVTGRMGEDFGQPVIKYANWTDKGIASFDLRVYAYDAGGKQLSTPHTVTKKPLRPIRPGEIREIETDLGTIPTGATIELVVPRIVFVDKSEWEDVSLAPEQRPKGG